jgi:proteasome lid subunit RPN8/RPN11
MIGLTEEYIAFTKERIEKLAIQSIIKYAQQTYPNEACGFILENGVVHPAINVVESLLNKSLTSRNAFLIDAASWNTAANQQSPITAIFHSHTNGDPNMSSADMTFLRWKNYVYVVLGLIDTNPVAAKLFWWQDSELKEATLNL